MDKVFLIFGYGVPKDIFKDFEYKSYLSRAFNGIFEYSQENKEDKIYIIFSGGKTDMIAPYKRSEAREMKKLFTFLAKRDFTKEKTGKWIMLTDANSLSTMENVINCRKIIEEKKLKCKNVGIFCEFTRKNRIARLVKIIFGIDYKYEIFNIDFSISANRYLGKDYILQKEKNALKFDLWALKSAENFKKYHKNFIDKFNFIRFYGPDKKQEALKKWWEKEGEIMEKSK